MGEASYGWVGAYTDCTMSSDTFYINGSAGGSAITIESIVSPHQPAPEDDGEESNRDWLDRRVEELCVAL